MRKFKIILIGACLSSVSAQALDLQSKFRNTDRSLFETISDYQTIEPGRFYFSNSASLISNPLVDHKSGKVLVDSMKDFEFSAVGSFHKKWEIGLSVPYFQTTATPGSKLNGYTGMGDLYLENKFHILDQVSIVPVYIMQSNQGLTGTGSKQGGYGLKVVGSFWEKSALPFYYSLGYYSLPNTTYGNIDQSQRIQASLGSLYKLTKEIVAGSEFYIDQAKGRSSKELLAHLTVHFNSFSLRAGAGSGFLNSDKMNDLRVFASLLFDLDFRNKNGVKISKVTQQKLEEKKAIPNKALIQDDVATVTISDLETKIESKKEPVVPESQTEPVSEKSKEQNEVDQKLKEIELIQQQLNKQTVISINPVAVVAMNGKIDPKLLVDNSLVNEQSTSEDDYTVIPAYTVKSLKELKKNLVKAPAVQNFSEVLKEKNQRLKISQGNLGFWISEYEAKRMSFEKAQTELIWALRVVDRRRNTLKDLYKTNASEMSNLPEGKYFELILPVEFKAKEIVKNKKIAIHEIKPQIVVPSTEKKIEVISPIVEKKEEPKLESPKKEELTVAVPSPQVESKKEDTKANEKKPVEADSAVSREKTLEAAQKKAWEASKHRTLSDIIYAKKKTKRINTPLIKAPNTAAQLIDSSPSIVDNSENVIIKEEIVEKDLPVVTKKEVVSEAVTPEKAKQQEVVIHPVVTPTVIEPKTQEPVIVISELPNSNITPVPESVVGDTVDLNLPVAETNAVTEPETIVVIPAIESLVSEKVEIKVSDKATGDTLEKVNMLMEQKKKEESETSKYQSLIKYYEDELEKIKKKMTHDAPKKEEPLKKLEVKIENKTETTFNQDGSIEIKQFKVNSIQERYQEEQLKEDGSSGETEQIPQRSGSSAGGLVEDGELEISSGPIY